MDAPRDPRLSVGPHAPRDAAADRRPGAGGAGAAFDVQNLRVHLVGIGGCGMSGLARMLRARGAVCSGSDMTQSEVTDALIAEGVPVAIEDQGDLLAEAQLLVISAAVKAEHRQVQQAAARGVPMLTYAQALGRCMEGRTGVAVAGTHGKSTTVATLGHALIQCGLDPTVIVGATCRQLDPRGQALGFHLGGERIARGPRAGQPGLLVAEACEFNRSFHNFHPTIGVVSSVEAVHLDIYGSLDEVVKSFNQFARQVAPASAGGLLLIAHEGAQRREVTAGVEAEIQTIGFTPAADWVVAFDPATHVVTLSRRHEVAAQWKTRLVGEHNAMNAATAAAVALTLGAERAPLERALAAFEGVDRRVQYLGERGGERGGVRVYDDYGHHPTEIDATLRALRQHERPEEKGGRLVCVFQPHQHSRTRFFLEEFAQSFSNADVVIVPHIYFVRDSEAEKAKVSAADLVDRLRALGVSAFHVYPFEAIVEQLGTMCRPNDLLVVMGAGPVWKVARAFLAEKSPLGADPFASRPGRAAAAARARSA